MSLPKLILAAAIAASTFASNAAAADATLQGDAAAQLRASGEAGEQADGYLAVVGAQSSAIRSQVDGINIKRRAYYTQLAASRGAKIEEVGATTACELFRTKVEPGQFYRLPDGIWRKRDRAPIPLPSYCG